LHQGIIDFFQKHVEDDFADIRMRYYVTDEKGHGREESRYYMICSVPEDLPDRSRWPGLKAIGVAISDTQRDGKRGGENRYYILSKFVAASREKLRELARRLKVRHLVNLVGCAAPS
jgi:hypothetical protein